MTYLDDDMCPNCITPWKCNGPHCPPLDSTEPDPCECGEAYPCAEGSVCRGRYRGRAADATDLSDERADILARFTAELAKVTGDGSKKRAAGEKPPWYLDDSHEAAVFSHLMKWKRGEVVDQDSGAHTLVHGAWRLLAIALRETGNTP
jgi:hypothetical protein